MWNLPERNTNFIGRSILLDKLKQSLDCGQDFKSLTRLVCHGLGGVGKTQLALEFACQNYKTYQGICWFSAESIETLQKDYISLGEELHLFSGSTVSSDNRAHMVKTWLENHPGWLLIYDNANKYEDIKQILPSRGGKILITSRYTKWPGKSIMVDTFNIEEAREYVEKLTGITNESDDRDALIKVLGCLPLALAQACAYIKKEPGIKDYLNLYQDASVKYELLKEASVEDHSKTVSITWNITLEKMEKENKESVALLRHAVFFHNENIPQALLKYLFELEGETDEQLKFKCNQAKSTAAEYSMIITDNKNQLFSIHCLVQTIIKHNLKLQHKVFDYFINSIQALLAFYLKDAHEIDQKRKLLLHLEEIVKNFDVYFQELLGLREVDLFLLSILTILSNAYDDLGDTQKQKALLERALIIHEKHYDKDDYEAVVILVNLGAAYGSLGNAQKSKEFFERALVIHEKHYGEDYYGKDHYEIAVILGNLANAYGDLGDTQKQKALLERALRIHKKHYGEDHYEVAAILADLGTAYSNLGDAQKQKTLLERALVIYKKHYGEDHYQVAAILGNLGNAYGDLGDAQKSKELLERALMIEEKYYGKDHYEIVVTLGGLGTAYSKLGDTQKSKELFERALAIGEKHYGKYHPQVAAILRGLGNVYGVLGDVQKKKELLERALMIYEKHYSKDHYQVATTLVNLSHACGVLHAHGILGNEQQKELLKRALIIHEKHYGKDHYQVAVTLQHLGAAYCILCNFKKAEAFLSRALIIFRKNLPENHQNIRSTLQLLAITSDFSKKVPTASSRAEPLSINKREICKLLLEYFDKHFDKLKTILAPLAPVIEKIICTEQFRIYLSQNNITFDESVSDFKKYAGSKSIIKSYLEYSLIEKNSDNESLNPCVLQAFSYVQQLHPGTTTQTILPTSRSTFWSSSQTSAPNLSSSFYQASRK